MVVVINGPGIIAPLKATTNEVANMVINAIMLQI
jgi:hypothetical protein